MHTNLRGKIKKARINDDELLLFAYIKQSVALENDTTLTGEEKTTQLQAIESKIEKLSEMPIQTKR